MLWKSMQSVEIKDINEKERRIKFAATTHEIDREGDILHIVPTKRGKGMLIPKGDKTPLKLFHDYRSYPVGFARDWELTTRKATYWAEFFTPEIYEEAEQAYKIAKTGVLGNSVGFLDVIADRRVATDEEKAAAANGARIREGFEYFEWECMEMSLTDVPANRGAGPIGIKEAEELVRKCLVDLIQAGEGCARKGCANHGGRVLTLSEKIDAFEMDIMKALNQGDVSVDRSRIEQLTGHLRDLDMVLWAKAADPDAGRMIEEMAAGLKDLAEDLETKPGFEEGPNEISYRVRDPGGFQEDSFRRITLQKEKPRVFAIIGRLKGETTTTLQALRFPKEDEWTIPKAREWVKDHPDVTKDLSEELWEKGEKLDAEAAKA